MWIWSAKVNIFFEIRKQKSYYLPVWHKDINFAEGFRHNLQVKLTIYTK